MMNNSKRSWDDMEATVGPDGIDATVGAKLDDNASAASRQKSCNACVRGKRRCDKQAPQCSRCVARGLDCVYQRLPPGATASSDTTTSATSATSSCSSSAAAQSAAAAAAAAAAPPATLPALSSSSAASSSSCISDFDMSFDLDSFGPSTGTGTNASPESFQADSGAFDFSIVDFLGQSTTEAVAGEKDLWDLHAFAADTVDKLSMPPVLPDLMPSSTLQHHQQQQQQQQLQPRQPIRDLSLIKDYENKCLDVDPLTVHDPKTRIGYSVSFLSKFPAAFAQTRALPFMHCRLWAGQLPKAILAAYSAATAYVGCNASNKGWTHRLLVDAAREIHVEGEGALSNADKLSRVQALLILTSIRMFDGDIGLRAAAEREMAIFKSWLDDLKQSLHDLEVEEGCRCSTGFLRDKMPRTWESWVFLESTRRTLLIASAIICLSAVLKSEMPDDTLWEGDCGFTASRHLWDASSSLEFFRAWRDKPHFRVQEMVFHDFWMYARPDDCDEFTRLMLTTQVGCDTMEHFMHGDVSMPIDPKKTL